MTGQVKEIQGMDVLEAMQDEIGANPLDTVILTRSNKLALKYNQAVRNRVLWMDTELDAGDRLMVVKNNYFWLSGLKGNQFIANGDMAELRKIVTKKNVYGKDFAVAELEFTDYPHLGMVEAHILLDSLYSDAPSITRQEQNAFFEEVRQDYTHLKSRKAQYRKVLTNEFFQSLQVKFGYAITAHKSQGGQWDVVFVDCSFLNYTEMDEDVYRWLYTAFTRAKEKLYVIGWPTNREF